jgi:hypothetical protein
VFADRVDDFILWDPRPAPGILVANNANVFRNVDAMITGASVRAGYRWASGFFARVDTYLTYGESLTDDRPIGQIPPSR